MVDIWGLSSQLELVKTEHHLIVSYMFMKTVDYIEITWVQRYELC